MVNEILAGGIIKERDMFITLFFCKFDLYNKKVTYTNAGHVPALFWDAKESKVEELKDGGTIIGQFSGIPFKEGERKISPGDKVLLFTDGLTEAADRSGNIFGREKVAELFESNITLSPGEFCKKSKEIIDSYSVGCSDDHIDDFTIMQIRVR